MTLRLPSSLVGPADDQARGTTTTGFPIPIVTMIPDARLVQCQQFVVGHLFFISHGARMTSGKHLLGNCICLRYAIMVDPNSMSLMIFRL